MLNTKEKFKNCKLYCAPLSKNVTDAVIEFVNETGNEIGFIPSRRQIDHNSGYTGWTTESFVDYVTRKKQDILICRDHGGPSQGNAIDAGITSLLQDVAEGFDLLHIDPFKLKFDHGYEYIDYTIDYIKTILSFNKRMMFEVGTEEAIYPYNENLLDIFLDSLSKRGLLDNIAYVVIQSGTKIQGTQNIGKYDQSKAKKMIDVCNKFNVLSKEHNGDYLFLADIKKRFELGLNAINIAPELGSLETSIIIQELYKKDVKLAEEFYDLCFFSGKWKKWNNFFDINSNSDFFNTPKQLNIIKEKIMKTSGHYLFNDKSFIELKRKLDDDIDCEIKKLIKKYLKNIFDYGII